MPETTVHPYRHPPSSKRGLRGSSSRSRRSTCSADAAGDGCCCRAKIQLLRVALFESLVSPALLRRRADQDLWARSLMFSRCSRLRLRLQMPYSSVRVVECKVLGLARADPSCVCSQSAVEGAKNLRPRTDQFFIWLFSRRNGQTTSGLEVGT